MPLPLRTRRAGGEAGPATAERTRIQVARWARHLPVAVLATAYAVHFSLLTVNVYNGYGEPAYDMGLFDQGLWLLSRFHVPFVTVMGRDLFGDHTAFILLLAVPLYWIYPHAPTLLVLQSCLLAAASFPLYLLGLRLLRSTVLATALAAAYLLNPALQHGNLEQFHPEAFMTLGIAVAVYAAVTGKRRLLVGAAIAVLLSKQDAALLVIPLGGWVAWRRDRRLGLWLAGGAAAWMAVCFEAIIPAFLGTRSFNMTRIPFGGGLGFVRATFTRTGQVWRYVTGGGRPWYLWQMASAVGWGWIFSPEVAAIGVLTFLENELADFTYMHQILYHYSMPLVPVLVAGTIWAVSRLRTPARRRALTGVVLCSAIVCSWLWGLAPWSRTTYPHWSPTSPQVEALNRVIKVVPPGAVVSAYYAYVTHLDHRRRIYMWPTPFSALYWGTYTHEGQRLPFAGQVQYLVLPQPLTGSDATVFAGIRRQYRVVARGYDVAVYRKVARPVSRRAGAGRAAAP